MTAQRKISNTSRRSRSHVMRQARRAGRSPRRMPDLPQFYYHTHFTEFLDFVGTHYQAAFRDSEDTFLNAFSALPHAAQCAYARLAGRKGYVFNRAKLHYPEIPALDAQFQLLTEAGLTRPVRAEDYPAFCAVMTKPEIVTLLSGYVCRSAYKASWSKPVLAETLQALVPFETLSVPESFIVQGQCDALRYLQFLYFGKIENNFQAFTLRDLGLVKTPDFKAQHSANYSPRFETVAEAAPAYFYAKGLDDFKTGTEAQTAQLIDTIADWPEPACDRGAALRDKLLQKLGGLSERLGDTQTALSLYARSDTPLCNERAIRMRWTRNADADRAWCQARLEALIDAPGSDAEATFAEDFYARKFDKKRTSAVTDMLRGAEHLQLDEAFKNTPEHAAAEHYRAQGETVFRSENRLWRILLGLVFWDIFFEAETAEFSSPFSRLPDGFRDGTFYTHHQPLIEARLAMLSQPKRLSLHILKMATAHYGTVNGIFRWNKFSVQMVQDFIACCPAAATADILRKMVQNWTGMKDGFPDLLRIKNGACLFTEIKAEGDVLRRNQLTRLMQLRAAGFTADIVRVDWCVDPNQIYVVVDVETTGGRASHHGVTEIGAVKVQDGKVIDTFQTLINPGRPIPANITRLTGISDHMVASAPRFEAVADDFRTFMGDAIFAAHNVNFDYGFISMEYARLGQTFRFPKLCTVASMRRYYPGHKSYSLKNLCLDYGIKLTSHHRALCDAEAAAELLFLVNDARLA